MLGQQRGEITQVRAQVRGRDGGVLPAGPGRCARRGAAAQARAVLADAPQGPRRGAGDHQRVQAVGVGDEPLGRGARLGLGIAGGLHEQPGLTARQPGDGRGAPAGPEDVDQPRVHALDRHRAVRQQAGHRVRGLGHARVAEHRQRHRLRRPHQADGRAEDHAERALGADQELRQIRAVLRQQVLQGVAGHLPGEPAELGADHAQVRRDQRCPARRRSSRRRPGRHGPGAAPRAAPPRRSARPGSPRCRPCGRTAGPATPQALLPIEPPMLARACVDGSGPKRRPCPAAAAVMSSRIAPGSTTAVRASGSTERHPVQVPGKVQHDAGADRVARDRGTAAAAGDRHAEPGGDVQRGGRLLGVPREDHHARHDAVVRRVGGVLGPAPGRVVDLAQPGAAQRGGQVTWRHGCRHARLRVLWSWSGMLSRRG